VNREMRRLQKKEEERARRRRKQGPRQKQRVRPGEERPSLVARFGQFVREVRQELKKVAWPTAQETTTFTVVVLIVTVVVTSLTFGFDFGVKKAVLIVLDAG
jgi:preprotein translocase subunit SecE